MYTYNKEMNNSTCIKYSDENKSDIQIMYEYLYFNNELSPVATGPPLSSSENPSSTAQPIHNPNHNDGSNKHDSHHKHGKQTGPDNKEKNSHKHHNHNTNPYCRPTNPYNSNPYGGQPTNPYGGQPTNPYGGHSHNHNHNHNRNHHKKPHYDHMRHKKHFSPCEPWITNTYYSPYDYYNNSYDCCGSWQQLMVPMNIFVPFFRHSHARCYFKDDHCSDQNYDSDSDNDDNDDNDHHDHHKHHDHHQNPYCPPNQNPYCPPEHQHHDHHHHQNPYCPPNQNPYCPPDQNPYCPPEHQHHHEHHHEHHHQNPYFPPHQNPYSPPEHHHQNPYCPPNHEHHHDNHHHDNHHQNPYCPPNQNPYSPPEHKHHHDHDHDHKHHKKDPEYPPSKPSPSNPYGWVDNCTALDTDSFYFSSELNRIVNTKYCIGQPTDNIEISVINYNFVNHDIYNFKIGDKKTNDLIYNYYTSEFMKLIKTNEKPNIPENFDKLMIDDIKHTLLTPIKAMESETEIKLLFQLPMHSAIYTDIIPETTNTEFVLSELKNLNKNDYAYVVLFFPGYKNDQQTTNYFITTLLVGYLLKNQHQNWDLQKNGIKGTKASVICMVTPDVDINMIKTLEIYYDKVTVVPYIGWNNSNLPSSIKNNPKSFININDVSKNNIKSDHAYNKVFTKINIFNKELFPFKKVVLLDSDLYPLGYFDTLFSLDTPAGCIEHRRAQVSELGISSWSFDRNQFCKHGDKIPKNLTDIYNIYASDINASLLVITPDNNIYNDMIRELQTPLEYWFGDDKKHKGLWLGNNFYNFYFLPEQNYLTQKFSGKWHSIDMGFTSWLIELENVFGFTFAGFVIKPWETQSAFHIISTNPYSEFSKINNRTTGRSYGYQLLNTFMTRMLFDVRNIDPNMYLKICNIYIKNGLTFLFAPFDPWEPEISIKKYPNKKRINELTNDDILKLSYDQKKLVYALTLGVVNAQNTTSILTLTQPLQPFQPLASATVDNQYLKQIIFMDYTFDNLVRHLYNINFIALSYQLSNLIHTIISNVGLGENIYPFGNTYASVCRFDSFDITDDDNDFVILVKKDKYKETIINIFEKCLNSNLQLYINLYDTNKFIQIIPDVNHPLYYYHNSSTCMTFTYFCTSFDITQMKFFNISYYLPVFEQIISDKNIKITQDTSTTYNNNYLPKVPWIDIFIITEDDGKLKFDANKHAKLTHKTFKSGKSTKLKVINKKINLQKTKNFLNEYYNDEHRLKKYIIRSRHSKNQRVKLFELHMENSLENTIINNLFKYVNCEVAKIYDTIDLTKYLSNSTYDNVYDENDTKKFFFCCN